MENTRDKLIQVTAELVRLKGFDRTSLQEVMDASNVGKGSFYHHFRSKDDLCLAVLEKDRVEFMQMLDECFSKNDAMEALNNFFIRAFDMHRGIGFVGGCLWGNTALEMSDSNSQFADITVKVFKDWIGKVEQVIIAAQAQNRIGTDIPAHTLANFIVASMEGGIMLSRLNKSEQPFKDSLESLKKFLFNSASTENSPQK